MLYFNEYLTSFFVQFIKSNDLYISNTIPIFGELDTYSL